MGWICPCESGGYMYLHNSPQISGISHNMHSPLPHHKLLLSVPNPQKKVFCDNVGEQNYKNIEEIDKI